MPLDELGSTSAPVRTVRSQIYGLTYGVITVLQTVSEKQRESTETGRLQPLASQQLYRLWQTLSNPAKRHTFM